MTQAVAESLAGDVGQLHGLGGAQPISGTGFATQHDLRDGTRLRSLHQRVQHGVEIHGLAPALVRRDEVADFSDHGVQFPSHRGELPPGPGRFRLQFLDGVTQTELNGVKRLDGSIVQIATELLPSPLRGGQGIAGLANLLGHPFLLIARAQRDTRQRSRQQRQDGPGGHRNLRQAARRLRFEQGRGVEEDGELVAIHRPGQAVGQVSLEFRIGSSRFRSRSIQPGFRRLVR